MFQSYLKIHSDIPQAWLKSLFIVPGVFKHYLFNLTRLNGLKKVAEIELK